MPTLTRKIPLRTNMSGLGIKPEIISRFPPQISHQWSWEEKWHGLGKDYAILQRLKGCFVLVWFPCDLYESLSEHVQSRLNTLPTGLAYVKWQTWHQYRILSLWARGQSLFFCVTMLAQRPQQSKRFNIYTVPIPTGPYQWRKFHVDRERCTEKVMEISFKAPYLHEFL